MATQVVQDLRHHPAAEARHRVPERDVVRRLDADGVELPRFHRVIVARPQPAATNRRETVTAGRGSLDDGDRLTLLDHLALGDEDLLHRAR